MQYQSWGSRSSEEMAMHGQSGDTMMSPLERVERLAAENAVVVFSMSSCCMCHVIKRLFCSLGVNPTVYELDEESHGKDMEKALVRLIGGGGQAVPAVFVGGKLVGGMDRVMACHINGTLVPLLKEAGALWL
ncbi:hypothetical protein SUGI_0967430 [Cryptomeria japonica]|uniref:glutaredoxin-C1 n=1 Tax=Cryptomeria japonica TaxID=3369 RepID=UPI002414B030|nr:glutaredoxin-C1 [Cryptomeria japonica]GLJ45946.1 hypothetical protein SUGI_0967430 [Cryptomeria japonica]